MAETDEVWTMSPASSRAGTEHVVQKATSLFLSRALSPATLGPGLPAFRSVDPATFASSFWPGRSGSHAVPAQALWLSLACTRHGHRGLSGSPARTRPQEILATSAHVGCGLWLSGGH